MQFEKKTNNYRSILREAKNERRTIDYTNSDHITIHQQNVSYHRNVGKAHKAPCIL